MTAEAIMTRRVHCLNPDTPVSKALMLMSKHRVHNMPIVDENNNYVGMFGVRGLILQLLPEAASKLSRHNISDLSFLPDNPDKLEKQLNEIGHHPVADYLDKETAAIFCKPKTPFPELLQLLYNNRNSSVPVLVVKGKQRKLKGVVSDWDILERVAKNTFDQEPPS